MYSSRWDILMRQSLQDVRVWCVVLAAHLIWHLVYFIVIWSEVQSPPHAQELLNLLINILLFDNRTTGVFTLTSWLLISVPSVLAGNDRFSNRLRIALLLIVWLVLCIANLGQIGYFFEYHRTFDFHLFALVYDDFSAIYKTVYQEYNLLLYLFYLLLILVTGAGAIVWFWNSTLLCVTVPRLPQNAFIRHTLGVVITCVIVLLFILAIRGSVGLLPLQYQNIEVTRDSLVNESALNPINAFVESYNKHTKTLGHQGISRFTDKSITEVLAHLFPDRKGQTLDEFVTHRVDADVQKPTHIFLLVMESYSSWALLDRYKDLGIVTGMQRLSRHPNGHLFLNFLPSSSGTMTSFASMITGMQDVSVFTNYQPESQKPYATSLPEQFARLGYTTRFFYGGSESWHDLGRFLENQGIEELYSWPDITEVSDQYVWGIPDGELFDFVLDTVDDSTPSINIIMSISYHPPYTLHLEDLGIDLTMINNKIQQDYPESIDATVFGHWQYADREMYRFVTSMENKLDNSLFVITGDHHANNKHLFKAPPLYETISVPLLLYGSALGGRIIDDSQPGTHLDIAPTLISLAAPKGFTYYSLGDNLLATGKQFAVSSNAVIARDFIARISELPHAYRLQDNHPVTLDTALVSRILTRYNYIGAYSWWRIVKGRAIEPKDE